MRTVRFGRRAIGMVIVTFAALTASVLAGVVSTSHAAAAGAPAQESAILLPQNFPFACHMLDEGAGLDARVYCWEEGPRGTRHALLDVDGRVSSTAQAPRPTGLGGPGNPEGTWVTIGRFRCEVLPRGVECVAIASGDGFLMNRTEIVAVHSPPGITEPAPVFGESATLQPLSGVVRIKPPGSRDFLLLIANARVPLGTVIDTSRGTVQLNSAVGAAGSTQTGRFHGGVFRVTQPGTPAAESGLPEGLTVLKLVGRLPAGCGPRKAGRRGNAAARSGNSKPPRLWGSAHGDFQTGGRYASATVGGTKWLTEDTCAGTLVKVARGVVTVNDFLHHRTVTVTAPGSYLAHPGREGDPAANGTSSHAPLWSALDGKVICGLAAHAPATPTPLLCAARPVPAPKRTGDSEGDPGFVFLQSTGNPSLARLSQYSWEREGGWESGGPAALASGQKWSNGAIDVTCTVSASTVRCANRSGHGFRITKSSYRGF